MQRHASNPNLGKVGKALGLRPHIVVNRGHRGDVSSDTMATTVEALPGAVYLDAGHDIRPVRAAMASMGLAVAPDT